MAKKNRQENRAGSPKTGVSKPESFTHGMVSDLDPHFQLEGSYTDAKNVRLTNSEGDTFTVENINGNSLFVDLATFYIDTLPDQPQFGFSYPTFYDRGPNDDISALDNLELSNRCSIVGHVSYANQLLLMIVGRFEWNRGGGTPFAEEKDRTIFLMVDFDHEFKVKKVTDLRVCYSIEGQYPDLNMDLDVPVRIEHIVENDNISRIYWTDNKNSLRTLNIKQNNLDLLELTSLDITPLMNPSQPVLDTTLFGSLPVGVYQYCYKYIDDNGGQSTFSPLSNMYQVSDQSFGNSTTYAGGPKGNLGTQGFQINIEDIDVNFAYIELYALFYDELNFPPRVAVIARNQISGTKSTFQHTSWNNEIDNGLEEILIESNTFDVCKDIAIKDNILFAANLRQKRNFISEKEWNVKALRYNRLNAGANELDAILTTNDPQVKHYQSISGTVSEVNSGIYDYGVTDDYGFSCGYGELLGDPNGMYPASGELDHVNYDGTKNVPLWTTAISNQRSGGASNTAGGVSGIYCNKLTYKYLADRMTCGAESFNYATNELGGCRVSFGVQEKIGDQSQNAFNAPFISSTSNGEELVTEFQDFLGDGLVSSSSGNTKFKTSMSLGGSKDPHLSGDKRGYQRGEVYRFGVQTYDLNGSPGNVLWIGDIETPHQYDILRMVNIKRSYLPVTNLPYSPFRATDMMIGGTDSLVGTQNIHSHAMINDHRISYIYGHTVPPPDVEWFSARLTNSTQKLEAYIRSNGQQNAVLPNNGHPATQGAAGRARAVPAHQADRGGPGAAAHDDTHHLFDLYVAFEFIIPDEVVKKISGFRVVRAERKEEDRRVVQQGLLNQTVQYGSAKLGQKYGYSKIRFSDKDNDAFGGDPVFVNQWIDNSGGNITPSFPEQPEYDTYLNGYLGLAENSHLAFFDDNVSDGTATTGGNTAGKVFYWPEREDDRKINSAMSGANHARATGDNNIIPWLSGPGTFGRHYRHSGYFGSHDKLSYFFVNPTNNQFEEHYQRKARKEVSGSVFTLDAPDSAFGIRPYVYREGDMLRIDDVLKLSNEVRYKDKPGTINPYSSRWNGVTVDKRGAANNDGENTHSWESNSETMRWEPQQTDCTLNEALAFSTRKDIDKDYSILIGKYVSYDPYFGIGMEIDGGRFAGASHGGDMYSRPKYNYGWQLPISNSKEISDGEIVPNGFFKVSKRVKDGHVSGFSNNTLGFCALYHHVPTWSRYHVFAAISPSLPANEGITAADPQKASVLEEDYTYDTVSTIQMGLRSILIEMDTRCSVVRKHSNTNNITSGALSDSYFEYRPDRYYSSWFAPINVSALYTQSHWLGLDENGNYGPSITPNNYNSYADYPIRSGYIDRPSTRAFGGASLGTEDHGEGDHVGASGSDRVPFKYLCSIVRNVVPYGGYNKGSIDKTRYIPCGNFHPVGDSVGSSQGHISQVFGGDTFVNLYSHQKTSSPYMKKSASRFQVFPIESYVNTDMRSGLTLNAGDTVVGKDMNQAPYSNDWLYNSVYSQQNTIKSGLVVDEENFNDSLNLPYEIAYSNTKILGQTADAFRQFPINQFHDMEGLYGEINRIINFKNEIYVLQDSAFAKLLVNPLSMLSDDAGTSLFTGTGETVENHIYISTKYGTRHRFSVALSEKSMYFVDSNFGRLFKYDTEKLISLGDALGQRNYLKYIIKDWEQRAYKICNSNSGTGGSYNVVHPANTPVFHDAYLGELDSFEKPDGSRNYLSDNPLSFLGIVSVYDFKNKELLVTFHNSTFVNKNSKRQRFARTHDNHTMGSSTHGEPVGISETLVYSEAVNAFTSKYSVAPPQWLTGSQGSFLICPENEINVVSIANFDATTGFSGSYTNIPYDAYGPMDSIYYRKRRCNPLALWIWDIHEEQKKLHFFGKKDDVHKRTISITSPVTGNTELDANSNPYTAHDVIFSGTKDVPEISYIEKVINTQAADSKIFDNFEVIMTPKNVDFSFVDYTTDISHDTITAKNVLDFKTELLDESEQLIINKRWDFDDTAEGWHFVDAATIVYTSPVINLGQSTINLVFATDQVFISPRGGEAINLPGKYNNLVRMKVKRITDGGGWQGDVYFNGYDPIRRKRGDYFNLNFSGTRKQNIGDPSGIDNDFVILEWDMAGIGDADGVYDDCIIRSIRIDLSDNDSSEFEIDWVEIGGLKAHKYIDGVLKGPLRTEKSTRRTRGTYAKIKYSAKTTEKFNIFALLAKYRQTY